jgi:DNA invertase Pin-like site-specific DNA recombinase
VGIRPELDDAIDYVRDGDTLVVTKLDRLARSVAHLVEIADRLQKKRVSLRILGMGIDTGTATGRMMLNIVGAIAQFEREMMLEGRKPTARAKAKDVHALRSKGTGPSEIARQLGISRASVYRCLAG